MIHECEHWTRLYDRCLGDDSVHAARTESPVGDTESPVGDTESPVGDPVGWWRWRYITPREVACKGTGRIRIDTLALDMMTEVREEIGLPFWFTSIYRSPLHNARIGGVPLSRHKVSDAFDVKIFNLPRWRLYEVARGVGFTGFGFYRTFLHIDRGARREWGQKNW